MLLPLRCPVCHATGPAPCAACIAAMRPAGAGPVPPGLDLCRSLLRYEGPARALITALKYRNDRAALAWLAEGMAALVEPPPGAVVTWAPTSGRRRRARGFDQAELLARRVARRWGVPCRRSLVRAGPAQTGRSGVERRSGPVLASLDGACTGPAPVVIVDDVMTTGSTLTAAGAVLRRRGAGWVGGLTAAVTPPARARPLVTSPRIVAATSPGVGQIAQASRDAGR